MVPAVPNGRGTGPADAGAATAVAAGCAPGATFVAPVAEGVELPGCAAAAAGAGWVARRRCPWAAPEIADATTTAIKETPNARANNAPSTGFPASLDQVRGIARRPQLQFLPGRFSACAPSCAPARRGYPPRRPASVAGPNPGATLCQQSPCCKPEASRPGWGSAAMAPQRRWPQIPHTERNI